jgi:hypothetical protein
MRILCISLLLLSAGCTTTVIPPPHPQDPVTVYLTDYGRHASILIPTSEDTYTEYAFGDWEFFALGHTRWWVGVRAAVHSPQATLGRREIELPEDDKTLRRQLRCARLMKFEASRARVEVLAINLDRSFRISSTRPTHSKYSDLEHVYDTGNYWGFHNCNHVTAEWLRQLGCEVKGPAILSTFVVQTPEPVP